jgi:hypothetical protein
MISQKRGFFEKAARITAAGRLPILLAAVALSPVVARSQTTTPQSSSTPATTSASKDRWLHVRVVSSDAKGETVRVNVPLELAEKVLPTVNHDRLRNGKVKIDDSHVNDVDLRTLVEAIHTAKDGEYVTVQGNDSDVRVAKQDNHLIIHVVDKGKSRNSQVEIKMPMKVVDALFSAGKGELDLVAALHALSAQGDTELVSVKDSDNTVRVWLDSKNITE